MNKTLLACALAVASIGSASAATIIPVNFNEPGVGLNDTTPAAPVGGNPGTTVGEQRRIAYQFAADLWGAVLESDVEIRVRAQFTALSCTATSGTLGSAGARFIQRDFSGSVPGKWYGEALANAISGENLSPAEDEINSNFNANLGQPNCLAGSGWYYGLDGNTPAGAINFIDVVMHEIGHGLNFQGFYNVSTGAPQSGFDDIYSSFVFDNVSGLAWSAMTNAQRVTAVTGGGLAWTGANVTQQVPVALSPKVSLRVTDGVTNSFDMVTAQYGPLATPANFSGSVVVGAPLDGCAALTGPAGMYTGKTVYMDRGTCSFKLKTANAQAAGAARVIIGNNTAVGLPGMGDDPTITTVITIPSVGTTQAAGTAIKTGMAGTVTAALATTPGQFAGSDASGRALLYSPAPVAPGSSFSHFDVSHDPNALMEPAINQDLDANFRLDMTPALFRDLGWGISTATARTKGGTCDTGVSNVRTPGLIGGANLVAADKLCATSAGSSTNAAYSACLAPFVARLRQLDLLRTSTSKIALNRCTR